MPTVESYQPGTPSWVDLASPDLASSSAFYSSLFGWEAVGLGPEAGGYRMFELGGTPVAGGAPIMMEGQPPAWTTYVSVDDADQTIAKVKSAGGMVFVEPMDVLDVGRMAVFADPTGAAIALWQPKAHKGAEIVNEPGAFTWNELNTRDTAAATSFYREVFGWGTDVTATPAGNYAQWTLDGRPIGGMMAMPADVPAEVPSFWLTYFAATDCDATVARAIELGATVTVAPMDIAPGRFSVLTDPQGAMFAVIAMVSA